jgi:hypothetical protein
LHDEYAPVTSLSCAGATLTHGRQFTVTAVCAPPLDSLLGDAEQRTP